MLRTLVVSVVLGCIAAHAPAAASKETATAVNIHVDEQLQPVVAAMLGASPTFRRQWNALAGREKVHVAVTQPDHVLAPGLRATTTIRRYSSGLLLAIVEIPPYDDAVELVAHELEHVIEQVEGVDLDSQAYDRSGDARRRLDGSYETLRAQDAGLAVANEVRAALRPE